LIEREVSLDKECPFARSKGKDVIVADFDGSEPHPAKRVILLGIRKHGVRVEM
jgi:hypothetical protein